MLFAGPIGQNFDHLEKIYTLCKLYMEFDGEGFLMSQIFTLREVP
jgi:hypothetical protein